MMKKLAAILLSLVPFKSPFINPSWVNSDYFNVTNKVVVSVRDEKKNSVEIRLYEDEDIDSVSAHVFDECLSLSSLMLSSSLISIDEQSWPTSLSTINFTGSETRWNSYQLETNAITVNYYALDEGFVHYWDEYVRPTEQTNLCDSVSRSDYQKLLGMYDALSNNEQQLVDQYHDKADSSIKDSLKYLKTIYDGQESRHVEKETSSTLMIGLIISAASVGMTFIAVLYLLKEKNIIK